VAAKDGKRSWVMVNRAPVLTFWAAVVAEVALCMNIFCFPFCGVATHTLCKLNPQFFPKNRRRPLKR